MGMARRPPAHVVTKLSNPEELGSRKRSDVSVTQIINDSWRFIMSLTAEQREQVATELKRFAGDLNLTDEQKEKLQAALAKAR